MTIYMIRAFIYPVFMIIIGLLFTTGPLPMVNVALENTIGTPTVSVTSQTTIGPSSTPSYTSTPSVTPSVTPTTTLMPLPAITLIFPVPTVTPTPTRTSISQMVITPSKSSGDEELFSATPRLKAVSYILALLWLILAVFMVIYIRQFR